MYIGGYTTLETDTYIGNLAFFSPSATEDEISNAQTYLLNYWGIS